MERLHLQVANPFDGKHNFIFKPAKRNPTWWYRRTRMERNLTLVATVILFVAVGLAAGLVGVVYKYRQGNSNGEFSESLPFLAEALTDIKTEVASPSKSQAEAVKSDDLCLTEGCIKAAAKIFDNMDRSVDPCEDFYSFTCGGFEKKNSIPDDKTSVNTFNVINDQLEGQLRVIVEEPVKEDEPKPFRLVKNLFRACMNKTRVEEIGFTKVLETLKELGGWPVLDGDKWEPSNFSWIWSVYRFRSMGFSVDYFIDFSVTTDLKNSTRRIIDLDQATLGLSREYLEKGLDDKVVKAYSEYQRDIAIILGADPKVAESEMKDALLFEMALANISLPQEKRRNATKLYNPMTISELQEKYKSIPWAEYINTLLPPSVQVKQDEVVIVNVPQYLDDFESLMSITPKRVQANYAMWRVAAASVSYLTDDIRRRQLKYFTSLSGKTEREPRWKECIDVVNGGLGIATGALYVRKYFEEAARQNALEMVQDISNQFQTILQEVEWMDDATRERALQKAQSIATHIAYPDELLENEKLSSFYENLELDNDNYYMSILNLTKFGTDFSFRRLYLPVNKSDWISHGRPAIVNAFYSSIENSIQFPAGILQGAFFNNDRPRYMNYGAIGWVIGHEITHGFDDQGRQFDKDGNLVDWWQPETKEHYLSKAQCIINQYGNYTVKDVGMNINGINTQGENIADNGGIKEAYRAYATWVERNGEEKVLPGLPYNQRQLFWISAASIWCSKYRPETMKMRLLTGVHSPGQFRVIGPLSNMESFADDFQCKPGSKMNPQNKCAVW